MNPSFGLLASCILPAREWLLASRVIGSWHNILLAAPHVIAGIALLLATCVLLTPRAIGFMCCCWHCDCWHRVWLLASNCAFDNPGLVRLYGPIGNSGYKHSKSRTSEPRTWLARGSPVRDFWWRAEPSQGSARLVANPVLLQSISLTIAWIHQSFWVSLRALQWGVYIPREGCCRSCDGRMDAFELLWCTGVSHWNSLICPNCFVPDCIYKIFNERKYFNDIN